MEAVHMATEHAGELESAAINYSLGLQWSFHLVPMSGRNTANQLTILHVSPHDDGVIHQTE